MYKRKLFYSLAAALMMVLLPVAVLAATSIGNNVSVGGTTTMVGAAFASSTLLIGTAGATENFYVNGTATSVGSATASSTLAVYSTLTVTGSIKPQSAHNNNYDIGAYTQAWKDVYASGTAYLTTITPKANILSITGTANPATTNAYDLGTSFTSQWRYLYAQTGVLVGDGTNTSTLSKNSIILKQGSSDDVGKFYVDSSGNVSATGTLTAFGNTTVGASTASGTLTIYGAGTFTGHVKPEHNNNYDLGAYGTAFRSVYASTSLVLGNTSNTVAITNHISQVITDLDIADAVSSTAATAFNCVSTTVNVAGAAAGDTATVAPQSYDNAFTQGTLRAYVFRANLVELLFCVGGGFNDTNPDAMSYRIDVWKH